MTHGYGEPNPRLGGSAAAEDESGWIPEFLRELEDQTPAVVAAAIPQMRRMPGQAGADEQTLVADSLLGAHVHSLRAQRQREADEATQRQVEDEQRRREAAANQLLEDQRTQQRRDVRAALELFYEAYPAISRKPFAEHVHLTQEYVRLVREQRDAAAAARDTAGGVNSIAYFAAASMLGQPALPGFMSRPRHLEDNARHARSFLLSNLEMLVLYDGVWGFDPKELARFGLLLDEMEELEVDAPGLTRPSMLLTVVAADVTHNMHSPVIYIDSMSKARQQKAANNRTLKFSYGVSRTKSREQQVEAILKLATAGSVDSETSEIIKLTEIEEFVRKRAQVIAHVRKAAWRMYDYHPSSTKHDTLNTVAELLVADAHGFLDAPDRLPAHVQVALCQRVMRAAAMNKVHRAEDLPAGRPGDVSNGRARRLYNACKEYCRVHRVSW